MNLKKQILSLGLIAAFFTSCNFSNKDKAPVYIQPSLLDTIFSNTYEGIIPCPDCPGIETIIKIFKDSTISRTVYYEGKSELPETKIGTWKLKDSIFEAKFDREKLFYKIKSGNIILRVGSDFKEVKGEFENDYILKKAKPFDLENQMGIYKKIDSEELTNELKLEKINKKEIEIILSSFMPNDSLVKCKSKFTGKINKENVIEVNLSSKNDSLQKLMKILFTKKQAHVYFENIPTDSLPFKCKDSLKINYQGAYLKN